jgi:hypothetical protein
MRKIFSFFLQWAVVVIAVLAVAEFWKSHIVTASAFNDAESFENVEDNVELSRDKRCKS